MKKIIAYLFFITISVGINAQSVEDELGFMYVKADYLLETDRYEDAIAEFNKIIDQDPKFKDALYKRAKAKFSIGAFLGSKKDLLRAFEFKGIDAASIELYGKTLRNLDELEAATITLKTASKLSKAKSGSSVVSKMDKKSNKKNDEVNKEESKEDNGGSQTTENENKEKTPAEVLKEEADKIDDKVSSILDEILGNTDDETTSGDSEDQTEVIEEEAEPVYVPDTSEKELYIDEDLTVFIKNGLGGRKILNQPNILILSETSGSVSVDVCVNENGKVVSAEFNKNESTISTQSLVSLAVRKSKEFWFERSDRDSMCGSMVFTITGRS